MRDNTKVAKRLIEKAATRMLLTAPFYGTLFLNLRRRVDNDIPTMATDGKYLFYNEQFVIDTVADDEDFLVGDLVHETQHCALKHMLRRGDRHPLRWNYAADFAINPVIRKDGFKLQDWVLDDPKYHGMYTEQIYNLLPEPPKGGSGGSVYGPGAGKKHGGLVGDVTDAASQFDRQTAEEVEVKWDLAVRQAVAVAKAAGTLPQGARMLIDALNAPKVRWQDHIRSWADAIVKHDYTWNRPNRRFLGYDFILPSRHSQDELNNLGIIADTSGSTIPVQKEFASEITGILADGIVQKVTMIDADAAVQTVREFEPGDKITELTGQGGTVMKPAFDYMNEHFPDLAGIICFTDMEIYDLRHIVRPSVPVLWTIYTRSAEYYTRLAANAPFGDTIHVVE